MLFDIDGTLIEAGGAGRRAFDRAAAALLGRPGLLDHLRLDGMTDRLIARAAIERARPGEPVRAEDVEALLVRYASQRVREATAEEMAL